MSRRACLKEIYMIPVRIPIRIRQFPQFVRQTLERRRVLSLSRPGSAHIPPVLLQLPVVLSLSLLLAA